MLKPRVQAVVTASCLHFQKSVRFTQNICFDLVFNKIIIQLTVVACDMVVTILFLGVFSAIHYLLSYCKDTSRVLIGSLSGLNFL